MRRLFQYLLVATFLASAAILPAWHQTAPGTGAPDGACGTNDPHSPQPAGHDADHCPLCQLATTATDVFVPLTAPLLHPTVAESVALPSDVHVPTRGADPTQARAPPA
jgi:hypothetical protein